MYFIVWMLYKLFNQFSINTHLGYCQFFSTINTPVNTILYILGLFASKSVELIVGSKTICIQKIFIGIINFFLKS